MTKIKTENFVDLLQIYSFLKSIVNDPDVQVPASIKFMEFEELNDNIRHNKFDTQLIKDIIIFSLLRLNREQMPLSSIFLAKITNQQIQEQLIDKYYAELAIQEFLCSEQGKKKDVHEYINKQFYELSIQDKFRILSFLISNVEASKKNNDKQAKVLEDDKQNKQNKKTSKKKQHCANKISCIGSDEKCVYFYVGYMPWSVFYVKQGIWFQMNKKQVENKINVLLQAPRSFNSLFLLKNLSNILKDYMVDFPKKHKKFPIHKTKTIDNQKQNIQALVQKYQNLVVRYQKYLKQIDNKYEYAPLNTQKQLQAKLSKASNLSQLLEWFKQFHQCARKGLYLKSVDEQVGYRCKFLIWANIFCRSIEINKKKIAFRQIVDYQISQDTIDWKPRLNIMSFIVQNAISVLEKKQKKYFEKHFDKQGNRKQKYKQQKQNLKRDSSVNSIVSSSNNIDQSYRNSINNKINLRKKTQKKFGITVIDSDDQNSIKKKLRTYQYSKYQQL